MSKNINKIIEEQREEFLNDICIEEIGLTRRKLTEVINKAEGKKKEDFITDICIWLSEREKSFYNWHKQSIITLLDTLIEEKKKDIIPDPETDYQRGYNSALDEDITNLTNIKNNIK